MNDFSAVKAHLEYSHSDSDLRVIFALEFSNQFVCIRRIAYDSLCVRERAEILTILYAKSLSARNPFS